jgi:outer membrane protein
VNLKWNHFEGFQTLSTIRTAEAQAEAARAQLQQAELAASAEVWARFHNYETALRKYESSGVVLKSATAARELALESYKSGVKTLLDLLNAETQLSQARSQQVAVRQEVFTALAYLTHVTGLTEKGHNGIDQPQQQ